MLNLMGSVHQAGVARKYDQHPCSPCDHKGEQGEQGGVENGAFRGFRGIGRARGAMVPSVFFLHLRGGGQGSLRGNGKSLLAAAGFFMSSRPSSFREFSEMVERFVQNRGGTAFSSPRSL